MALLVLITVSVVAGLVGLWRSRKLDPAPPTWLIGVGVAGHVVLWIGLTVAWFAPLAFAFGLWVFALAPFAGLASLGVWRYWRRQLMARGLLVDERRSRRSTPKALLFAAVWVLVIVDLLVRPSGRSLGTAFVGSLATGAPLRH